MHRPCGSQAAGVPVANGAFARRASSLPVLLFTAAAVKIQRCAPPPLRAGVACCSASSSFPPDYHADDPSPFLLPQPSAELAAVQRTRVHKHRRMHMVAPASIDEPKASASVDSAGVLRTQQELFRHRFIVSSDLLIRVPLEAPTLLRTFVTHEQLCGVLQVGLEAHRPKTSMRWSSDSKKMLSLPNAGGSSLLSEVLSFELLERTFGAKLQRTEMELRYKPGSKITDYAVTVCDRHSLGVSVTRAFKFEAEELTEQDAYSLLARKLTAINISSRNVRNYFWRKQVLHVWARTYRDAQRLERQYLNLPPELRTNTIVLITLCHGVDWIW